MFEYITANKKKVVINPKYIIAITEDNCNNGQCYIITLNGSWFVNEPYEKVCEHYSNWLFRGLANG